MKITNELITDLSNGVVKNQLQDTTQGPGRLAFEVLKSDKVADIASSCIANSVLNVMRYVAPSETVEVVQSLMAFAFLLGRAVGQKELVDATLEEIAE